MGINTAERTAQAADENCYTFIKLQQFEFEREKKGGGEIQVSLRKQIPGRALVSTPPARREFMALMGPVTVYRLPIRLPAKSALTWPVV